MAKVELTPPFKKYRGTIGDLSYRWMYGKLTVMKKPDMSGVEWSEPQKSNRQRFAEAIRYAQQAMADPKLQAYYEELGQQAGRQPFRVAVSDFRAGINLLEEK